MITDKDLIIECGKHNSKAQQILYDKYSRLLLGICMRYAKNKSEAEDILQDSFIKIFFSIKDFSETGSFVGWLRRITTNTAIDYYNKNLKYKQHVEIEENILPEMGIMSFDEDLYTSDELREVLNELPTGYRTVFNLFAIEGYMHKEIAEMLGIDVNTSKSQYCRAKALIRTKLEELNQYSNIKIA